MTEWLLHEENKVNESEQAITNYEKVMAAVYRYRERGPKCYNYEKYGHIKRNCTSNLD